MQISSEYDDLLVRAEGLEPPRFSPPEPKSGASTSSATPAARTAEFVRRAISPLRVRLYSNPPGRTRAQKCQPGQSWAGFRNASPALRSSSAVTDSAFRSTP